MRKDPKSELISDIIRAHTELETARHNYDYVTDELA